jgi:hypothetical protein
MRELLRLPSGGFLIFIWSSAGLATCFCLQIRVSEPEPAQQKVH